MKIRDKYFSQKDTDDLRRMAAQITKIIDKNKEIKFDTAKNFKQMLILEKSFVRHLKRYSIGMECYDKFLIYITQELGNILNAKPYFREKSTVFNKYLSKAFKDRDVKVLMKFHPNYKFIQFAMKNMSEVPKPIQEVYNRYLKLRRKIIENNIPLAINRSKLFNNATPKDHLDLIDFISICVCGLADAIDKYVGDYTRAGFANTAVNRMSSSMMEEYNKNLISMYPKDKKIVYRIRSIAWKTGTTNPKELVYFFNKSLEEDKKNGKKPILKKKISEFEIMKFLNSSGILSIDYKSKDSDKEDPGSDSSIGDIATHSVFEEPSNGDDNLVETKDLVQKARIKKKTLSIIEQKIVSLKYPDLH